MKVNRMLMQMLRTIMACLLFFTAHPCAGSHDVIQDEQIIFSFDNLFPSTPYKDALGACMQVLGYLDQLCHEHERGELASFSLVHDAFLGKVVSARHKVNALVSTIHNGAVVADDNVDYLNAILGYISKRYHDRIAHSERTMLASSMINEMTQQLLRITDL